MENKDHFSEPIVFEEPKILGEFEISFTNIDDNRFEGNGCQRISYCSCDCNDFCWARCLAH